MRKFVIEDNSLISPFNEPARDLSILNRPLKMHHDEVIDSAIQQINEGLRKRKQPEIGPARAELPLEGIGDLAARVKGDPDDEIVVYRDNLYFDEEFFHEFFFRSRHRKVPSRAVLPASDLAWRKYAVPLSRLEPVRDSATGQPLYYPLDLWYFPPGHTDYKQCYEVPIESEAKEVGYYNVPDSMSNLRPGGAQSERDMDLTHLLTLRSCLSIDSWAHVYFANIILGVFSRGRRFEKQIEEHNLEALRMIWRAIMEQKQVLSCSKAVQVGEGTVINPSAIISGPTTIGRNCYIGPGVVIDNSIIGDNVSIDQGCQLMLSVVGNNCFLPFRAALFLTTLMEYTIVAQNTCLQMCVVGRNSFVGAGNTFTDFNLVPAPLRTLSHDGSFRDTGQPVLGGCVGHNSRLGSGLVVMPGRIIESDVVLFASPTRRVVNRNISYEESDHFKLRASIAKLHKRRYPRFIESEQDLLLSWDDE